MELRKRLINAWNPECFQPSNRPEPREFGGVAVIGLDVFANQPLDDTPRLGVKLIYRVTHDSYHQSML